MSAQIKKKVKCLNCDFCKISIPTQNVNFPEDLFDLMVQYNIDQLIWLCDKCKLMRDKSFSFLLTLVSKQHEVEKTSAALDTLVGKQLEMENTMAILQNKINFLERQQASPKLPMNVVDQCKREEAVNFIRAEICTTSNCASDNDMFRGAQEPGIQIVDISSSSETSQYNNTQQKNVNPVTIVKEILKDKIKIDSNELKGSKAVVTEFLNGLVKFLKETDATFNLLFEKLCYTGSFYEDLRISSANEFDINLVLKFPRKDYSFLIEFVDGGPFATYRLEEGDPKLSKFFESGYLMPGNLNVWMQSIIDKTLANPDYMKMKPKGVREILRSQSGPAKTVKLVINDNYIIDIDLVPVLQLTSPSWPKSFNLKLFDKFEISHDIRYAFLVPKPLELPISASASSAIAFNPRTWRVHLPEAEKAILHDVGCVKPLIKLLKLLRDQYKWKILASYYLKTVLLLEVVEESSAEYWREDKIFERLMQVLEKLASYVKGKNIPHLFFPEYNLLEKMNDSLSVSISGCLQKLIRKLEDNPQHLIQIFACHL